MTPRTTRTYTFFLRWPKWRSYSGYDKPVNWALFRWWDFVPLGVGMTVAGFAAAPGWVATLLAAFYFVMFPVVFSRRLRARQRYCATQGHVPYRPVPEVDEWECIYCGTSLAMREPATVATAVANEASKVRLRTHRSQAYWSDRR